MPDKNNTKRQKRPPLNKEHYAIYWLVLWSLDYEGASKSPVGFRQIQLPEHASRLVRRRLRRLARLADVPEQELPSKTFDDAMKAIYLRSRAEAGFDTAPAFRLAAMIGEHIERCGTKTKEKRTRKRSGRQETVWLMCDTPHLGLRRGEGVTATATSNLKVWDIAIARKKGEESSIIGRVVAISADSITLRRVKGDETYSRKALSFLGRANPEPVGRDDGLTDDERTTVQSLQRKLERLGEEDDQIIRCSARYELEKKIFDITHPIETGDSGDDWPEELRIIGE